MTSVTLDVLELWSRGASVRYQLKVGVVLMATPCTQCLGGGAERR